MRIRDLGYSPGTLPTGSTNSILDVPGVAVGQITVSATTPESPPESTARKGVTVILPRPRDQVHIPCHAGTHTFNGNGELTGTRQIKDWGFSNGPVVFTNSLSLGTCIDAVWDWTLERNDRLGWSPLDTARNYGTPIVGETADWLVNCHLPASRLEKQHVRKAFDMSKTAEEGGKVKEGSEGGGAGMTCHQFLGGTGSASRIVGKNEQGEDYVLAVLVQTNYGLLRDMHIGGVPVGRLLEKEKSDSDAGHDDVHAARYSSGKLSEGSFLVAILTNAPLLPHQLDRVARHATAGLAQVGGHGIGRTFSGDIFLALSTADHPKEQLEGVKMGAINPTQTYGIQVVKNESKWRTFSFNTQDQALMSYRRHRPIFLCSFRGNRGGYSQQPG